MSLWTTLRDVATRPIRLPWPSSGTPASTSAKVDASAQPPLSPYPAEAKASPELARRVQVGPWEDKQPVWTDWTTGEAIASGFKASNWVYSCVQKLAWSVPEAPVRLGRKNAEGEVEAVPGGGPLEDLFENPCEWCDGQDLMERWTQHLLLGGNALGLRVRLNDRARSTKEVWPLQPDQVKPVRSRTGYISHYELKLPGERPIPLPVEDVIHIMIQDPGNPFWGCSPLQALGRVVDTEVDALTWWRTSIRNRGAKDGAITFPFELTEEQYELVKERLLEQALGPYNARIPWIFGNEAKYQAFGMTPAEMDFVEARKMTREEICALFGIPLILFGLGEYSSYNNIITARLILWLDTIAPFQNNIAAALTRCFRDELPKGQRLFFDRSRIEALMGNYAQKVETAIKLCSEGVPFNVASKRLQLGLPDIEGGDVGYIASSRVPIQSVGSAAAAGALGAPEEEEDEAQPRPGEEDTPQAGTGKVTPIRGRRSLRGA